MTTTVTELIVTGNDDGYMQEQFMYGSYMSGSFSRTSARIYFQNKSDYGDIDMQQTKRTSYFRFQTVDIPQGATISSAKLQLAYHSNNGNAAGNTVDIYGNDVDDASAPSSVSDFQGKTKTTEKVTWTIPSSMSGGTYYDTPDITDVVKEIVDRTGWSANNDMMFILTPSSWNSSTNWLLQYRSYNYGGSFQPKLVIEYSTATASAVPMALNTYQQMRNN